MGFTLTQQLPAPTRHGWNVAEFERLFDAGFFAPNARLELIEGEVWKKIPPEPLRAVSMSLAFYEMMRVFGEGFCVRARLPLVLGENSQPEPDIAIVSGSPRDHFLHPTTAILVIEISDSTLVPDQQTKSALYARAGIEEYWIVNLIDSQLEVRRNPAPMPALPLGFGYRSTLILQSGEVLSPLAAPAATVRVEDLLP